MVCQKVLKAEPNLYQHDCQLVFVGFHTGGKQGLDPLERKGVLTTPCLAILQ